VRRLLDERLALLATAVAAVNPWLIEFAGEIRSEPSYILFSLLGLLLLAPGEASRGRSAGGAIAAGMTVATRTVGATLLVAIVADWFAAKRWRLLAGSLGILAVAAAGWYLWASRSADPFVGVSYLAEVRALWRGSSVSPPLPERIVRSGRYYATDAIPWLLALPSRAGTLIDNVVGVGVLWLSVLAGAVALLRRWRIAVLYLVAYGALLTVWLFAVDRFALPIVPLLLVFALAGAQALGRRAGERTGVVAAGVVTFLLLAGAAPRTSALLRRNRSCHAGGAYPLPACLTTEQASYFDALRWIDGHLPEDAVLLTSKPGALWLYTGRLSVSYDAAIRMDSTDFLPGVRRDGAGWILLNKLHNREPTYLLPLMRANCRSLRLVASFPPASLLFSIDGIAPDETGCASLDEYAKDLGGLEIESHFR